MTTHLLDANVLIALVVDEHEHHARVLRWAAGHDSFVVCPITEGALVRFLLRVGESAATASGAVAGLRAAPSVMFWSDEVSYADVDLRGVRGHRQVTDAYLAGLARARGARLATLDVGLVALAPDVAVLVP